MAVTDRIERTEPWASPRWPEAAPGVGGRVVYNPLADELVVRFPETGGEPAVVMPIAHADEDANLLVGRRSGEVIGVQVDALLAHAAGRYPHWRRLAEPAPPPEAVAALVAEVRALFERYGIG